MLDAAASPLQALRLDGGGAASAVGYEQLAIIAGFGATLRQLALVDVPGRSQWAKTPLGVGIMHLLR